MPPRKRFSVWRVSVMVLVASVLIAIYFGAKPLARHVMDRIDEVYDYEIAPGYFISGHRHIDELTTISGGSGVVFPDPSAKSRLVLHDFAVVGHFIVGRTIDADHKAAFFIIDTRQAVVHHPLTPTAYSDMLRQEGIAAAPTLEKPNYWK